MKDKNAVFERRLHNARHLCQMLYTGVQARFAEAIKKSPSYVNGMLNEPGDSNHKNIGEGVARQIEKLLQLEQGWMDKEHKEQETIARRVVIADASNEEYVMIPHREVRFAAGDGEMVFDEPTAPPLAFTRDWIRKNGLQVDKLVVAYASGDSMVPRIHDGDTLLLDTASTRPVDGKIFAIRIMDQLRVKRIYLRLNAVVLASDNPAYPQEELSLKEAENLVIVGRVVWISGNV